MLLSPYFWLAIVALLTASYVAGCVHERGEVVKLQAEWDAEKKAVKDDEDRIKSERAAADAKAASDAAARDAVRNSTFADLAKRHAATTSKLNACLVDRDVLDGLLDTVHSANSSVERAPTAAAKDPPAAAGPTTFNQWFDTVAKYYTDCVNEVVDWNTWYDGQRGAQ